MSGAGGFIKKFLNFAWRELVFGSHIFALSAASVVLVSAILLNIPITWDFLLVVYLIFYSIYLYDHFSGAKKNDYLTNLERVQYLKDKRMVPLVILVSILTSILILFYYSNFSSLFFGLIIIFFGLLYGSCFKKVTKKVIAFKNFFVSFVWMALVVFLIWYYSYPLTLGAFLMASFVFLKVLIIQVFFDIRDIKSDKEEKLLTLPVIFGKDKVLSVLKLASVLLILMVFSYFYFNILYSHFNILPNFLFLFFLIILFDFYYLGGCQYLKNKYCPYLLAASEPILWLILVLFGKFLLC